MSRTETALSLAAEGFHVFRVRPNSKLPYRKGWQGEATRDEATIRGWDLDGLDLNLGISTSKFGDDEALLVVDVDNKGAKQGDARLRELQHGGLELPNSRTHLTPSGGRHIFFRSDVPRRQGVDVLAVGLDTRSAGGFVVAPSSRVPLGEYTVGTSDAVANLPPWVADRCGVARQKTKPDAAVPVHTDADQATARAVRYLESDAPLAISGQGGNQTTFKVAARLKDFGVNADTAHDLMLEHWNDRCSPPWDLEDLVRIVDNAYAYGIERQGIAAPEASLRVVAETNSMPPPAKITTGTDVNIARAFLKDLSHRYGQVVVCEGSFWHYVNRKWTAFSESEIRTIVHEYDGRAYGDSKRVRLSKGRIDSILNEARAIATDEEFFSQAPSGVACQSGFVRFKTDGTASIEPNHPDHRARHVISASWQPGGCPMGPLLTLFLDGLFRGDPDADAKVQLLGEVLGAGISGRATRLLEPKAIILHGKTAENGKSQVLDLARLLLPPSAVSSLSPGKFGDERYIVQLAGRLLNACDELGSASAIAGEQFKIAVTGEPLTAREVYKAAVTFRSAALQMLSTNVLPSFIGGFDRGIRRRLLVIEFNRTIPRNERIERIGQRIATEESDALLAFAIEGASRLIARRFFIEPPSSVTALRNWIFGADPVLGWFADRIEFDDSARLVKSTAYGNFKSWALCEGFSAQRLPSINHFVSRVTAQDSRIGEGRNNDIGRYFVGLKLRPDAPPKFGRPSNDVFGAAMCAA